MPSMREPTYRPNDERDGRQAWKDRARCVGMRTSIFFPTDDADEGFAGRGSYNKAKDICSRCPVVQECLDYALRAHEDFGCWGMTTPKERKDLRRQRRRVNGQQSPN